MSVSLQNASPALRRPKTANQIHHALAVPELLLLYFDAFSGQELVKLATVCRVWSEVALELLWSTFEVPLSAILRKLDFIPLEESSKDHAWLPMVSSL